MDKKRNKRPDYIANRISQLMDDAAKAHREEDKQWYYRICQELQWAKEHHEGRYDGGCVLTGVL